MFQVIDQLADLKAKSSALSAVYLKHAQLSFYSPAYLVTAVEQFLHEEKQGKLFLVTYSIKNEIVNYIPWCIDSNQTLRFIFDIHTDYCACIGPELSFNALKELAKLILDHQGIKRIELENLLPNDGLLNGFRHFLGLGAVISCYNNHSYVTTTPEKGFYDHLKSNQKSELKRVQKKNEAYNFEVFNGTQALPLAQMKLLKQQMIATGARSADFFDEAFINFCTSLYAAGELELFAKWNETNLVSASIVLKNGDFRMVWIDLYADIQFINLSAYVDYIQYLQQFPNQLFSFGRGSYDYKSKNFQPQLQNLYNLRYSKSKFSFFFSNYQTVKQFTKRLIKERK